MSDFVSLMMPDSGLTAQELERAEAAINELLESMGRPRQRVGGWEIHVRYPELDDRSIVRAVLDGDVELVGRLLVRLIEQSEHGARRLPEDRALFDLVRRRVTDDG